MNENKYKEYEAEKIAKSGINAELTTTDDYEYMILQLEDLYESTGDEKYKNAAEAIKDINREELVHAGEFSQILANLNPENGQAVEEGMKEVREMSLGDDIPIEIQIREYLKKIGYTEGKVMLVGISRPVVEVYVDNEYIGKWNKANKKMIKDAKPIKNEYEIIYKNLETGERDVETIKANSVKEAFDEILRGSFGVGTYNLFIMKASKKDETGTTLFPQLYGRLSDVLKKVSSYKDSKIPYKQANVNEPINPLCDDESLDKEEFEIDINSKKVRDYKSDELIRTIRTAFNKVGAAKINNYAEKLRSQGGYRRLPVKLTWDIIAGTVPPNEIVSWYDKYNVTDDHITNAGIKVLKEIGVNLNDSAISDMADMGWNIAGRRIPEHNEYHNRYSPEDLRRTFDKVMSQGNDPDVVKILVGQLAELKKDYLADINNQKLDKAETKVHYKKYKDLVSKYKNSQISKEYKNAVDEFITTIKDASIKDTDLIEGKTYTSKSGHKLTVKKVIASYSDYNGEPGIKIKYDYETTDGRKGSSECSTRDFFNMMKDANTVRDALNGKLSDLNAKELVEKALRQGPTDTERSDRRGINEYSIFVHPRERDNSIYIDIIKEGPDKRYDADDYRYYNRIQERILSKKVYSKEDAIKVIEDFKNSVRDSQYIKDSEKDYEIESSEGDIKHIYANSSKEAVQLAREAFRYPKYLYRNGKIIYTFKDSNSIKDSDEVNNTARIGLGNKYHWERKYADRTLTITKIKKENIMLELNNNTCVMIPIDKFYKMLDSGEITPESTVEIDGYDAVPATRQYKV